MKAVFDNGDLLQFSITRSDYIQLSPKWRDTDACIGATRLYFVESGRGFLQVGAEQIPLEPGFVYLIPAYFHFGYGCSGLKKLYFHFRITAVDQVDLLSTIGAVLKLPYEPETLKLLLSCYKKTDLYSRLQLQMLLQQTICRFAQTFELPGIPIKVYSEVLNQAISYIQTTLSIKLTAKSISNQLFISESKLRNAFKNELNMTIGDYIDLCVFRQAKLLLQSPMSLEQISQRLGFCDQFYFSRRFKQRYHMTPTQYRKQLKSEQT